MDNSRGMSSGQELTSEKSVGLLISESLGTRHESQSIQEIQSQCNRGTVFPVSAKLVQPNPSVCSPYPTGGGIKPQSTCSVEDYDCSIANAGVSQPPIDSLRGAAS